MLHAGIAALATAAVVGTLGGLPKGTLFMESHPPAKSGEAYEKSDSTGKALRLNPCDTGKAWDTGRVAVRTIGRVGVAARARHEHIPAAQPVPQAQDHAQLPEMAVSGVLLGLTGLGQVVGVLGGHEGGRRARGHLTSAEPVHLLQDGHRLHQLARTGPALEVDRGQHVRGELTKVGVGGLQLRQPAVVPGAAASTHQK